MPEDTTAPLMTAPLMTAPLMTEVEMRAYAARHGLSTLAPEHLARMRELAARVAQTGLAVPRMQAKSDEPAPVFVVPLPPRG